MVEITSVESGSAAEKNGIENGDILISINGNEIRDVLDYRFYLTEKLITLKIHRGAVLFDVTIKKRQYDDIGLDFATFLMDKQHICKNKCVFCFIDQLPRGMRDTLYFKDDDDRMSFFRGSYVTLTNLDDKEISRIVKMKLSPINISVHTTNPELRTAMMKNPAAAKIMDSMRAFFDAGIYMNCQIVLCRGINDGEELERSMCDLAALYPQVQSVSIVPCGITAHRDGLTPLTPYSPAECETVIKQIEDFADECMKKFGTRIFFAGDEMYIKSGRDIHRGEYYEEYSQIQNGVGMIASMRDEIDCEIEAIKEDAEHGKCAYNLVKPRNISIATGECAYDFICSSVEKLIKLCYNFKCKVYKVKNEFFGENITVAGLLTGNDVISQLSGKDLGTVLYLPAVMLRYERDITLDGISGDEISRQLGTDIRFIENDGAAFVSALLSEC